MSFFNAMALSVFVVFVASGLLCALLGEWTGRSRVLCGLVGLAFGPFVALVILTLSPEGKRERLLSVWAVWLYAIAFMIAGALAGGNATVHWFAVRPEDVAINQISTTDNPIGALGLFFANFVVFIIGAVVGGQAGGLAVGGIAALYGNPNRRR